jgi:hypothetical protein
LRRTSLGLVEQLGESFVHELRRALIRDSEFLAGPQIGACEPGEDPHLRHFW